MPISVRIAEWVLKEDLYPPLIPGQLLQGIPITLVARTVRTGPINLERSGVSPLEVPDCRGYRLFDP